MYVPIITLLFITNQRFDGSYYASGVIQKAKYCRIIQLTNPGGTGARWQQKMLTNVTLCTNTFLAYLS
jgi:hypothetical protein